jgi:putative DNA primase/helicase
MASAVPPHVQLIRALGGDETKREKQALCPAHDDHEPSLSIGPGRTRAVLLKCWAGCSQDKVIATLRDMRLWPVPGVVTPGQAPRYTEDERRRYALDIVRSTRRNRGAENARLLAEYFKGRGIDTVPLTAMLALPIQYASGPLWLPREPAMVFPIHEGNTVVGAHVTWLAADVRAKRDAEPKKQFFGPVRGGYVKLHAEFFPDPDEPLVIAEGVETALSAMSIFGVSQGIAALAASFMPHINPPFASNYVIAADHDKPGIKAARMLAAKLFRAGRRVSIALPPMPGTDWNDLLQGAGR